MNATVTGRDALLELEKCMDRAGFDWCKLVSIAKDNACAMCSEKVELAGWLKHKLKENYISMSAIHCIIHQKALCGKGLKVHNVMNNVVKTVNFFDQAV